MQLSGQYNVGHRRLVYDMQLMMAGIRQHGMHPAVGAAQRLQALLGRPLRNYREAVREMIQLS
ncbi:hypothetical protein [Roseateles cavernae]|uniref:hypothetical protein n=1 Tax=Roseateles cavernae TaxID=3153578 RepID=UPI0032E463DE